jgi:outer membrane biosynthesis protein TonB
MNRRKIIPFVFSIMLLAGLASARRGATLATPQGDEPKPKPSASVQPKEKPKPPKPEQPKKPPPDEGGW